MKGKFNNERSMKTGGVSSKPVLSKGNTHKNSKNKNRKLDNIVLENLNRDVNIEMTSSMINVDRDLPNVTDLWESISVNLDHIPLNMCESVSQCSVRLDRDQSKENFISDKDSEDDVSQSSKEINNMYK